MIEEIKSKLNLAPHIEGGFFNETYRSDEHISANSLPARYTGKRHCSSAIYYLLTPETCSTLHRLNSDEIYHFYLGDPVEMLQLYPGNTGKIIIMGQDILNGMEPQVIVKKNVWQGSRLKKGGRFALMGTTVAPGFDYSDFESGNRNELISIYPEFKDVIIALTKAD